MISYCVIGARGGSKSILDKNISKLAGKSLLSIAVNKAASLKCFDKIYVSSDKESYKNEVPENSKVKFVLRPKEISSDDSIEIDYLRHVITSQGIPKNSLISRMQCTSPFQSKDSIKKSVNFLMENNEEYDSVQLITAASPSIYKAMIIDENKNILKPATSEGSIGPSNRQKLPATFFRSNFYVTKVDNILNNEIMGINSYGMICEEHEKIDIDSEFDLILAKAIIENVPNWLDE